HDRRKQEPACILPHISSADETQRRIIILPDARECDARSVSIILKAQSDMACEIIKTRVILPDVREPRAELAIAPESVLRVDSGGAIEAIGTLQIRKDTAHSRPGEDVGSDAGNAVVGAARAEKLVHPRTRLDVEQPDGYAPYLPREAGAREDLLIQTNSPREEGLGRLRSAVLEEARALQEELAFLGKEQVEPGEVELHVVGLDLSEVGIDGQVEREARREAVLEVDAEVARHVHTRRRARRIVPNLLRTRDHVRLDLDVPAAANVADAS